MSLIDDWINRQKTAVADWVRRRLGLPDPYAPEPNEPGGLVTPPVPGGITGSTTFTWKVESESDGNVCVITPCKYRWRGTDSEKGKQGAVIVNKLFVRGGDKDGHVFKSYQPRKDGQTGVNGNRIHHRGKAPGKAFGKDFDVVAQLAEGGEEMWDIRDGAKRIG